MNILNEKELNSYIGKRISEYRNSNRCSLTQAELAKRVDLSRASIINIEKGVQQVSISNLIKICIALDVSIREVLPSDEEIHYGSQSNRQVISLAGEETVLRVGSLKNIIDTHRPK